MSLSGLTAFSGITDNAPASQAYFQAKFDEVYGNLSTIASVAASASDLTASVLSTNGRWHVAAFGDDFQSTISHAYAAGGGTVWASATTYGVLGVRLLPGVTLDLNGATLQKAGGARSTHILEASGSTVAGPSSTLSGVLASNSTQVPAPLSTLTVGDLVLISDLSYALTSGASDLGQNLELNWVVDASSITIGLRNPTIGSYLTTAGATITKVSNGTGYEIRNGTLLLPSGTSGGGFWGHLTYGVTLDNVRVQGAYDDAAILFERSAGGRVTQSRIQQQYNPTVAAGLGNGIEFEESSHHFRVAGNHISDSDIGITAGTRSRHMVWSGNLIEGGQAGIDLHGQGCAFINITGNVCHGNVEAGITVGQSSSETGDRQVLIADNLVVNAGNYAIQVLGSAGSEARGVTISGNRIVRPSQNNGSRGGILVQRAYQVTIRGNDISELPTGASAGMVLSAATDVLVQGNSIRSCPNNFGISLTDAQGPCGTVRIVGNDFRDISSSNVRMSGNHADVWVLGNTADDATNTFTSAATVAQNVFGARWDASMATDGLAVSPAYTFQSEVSLGWYRSAASTMAPSYGTVDLAPNAVRLSIRTIAGGASATSLNVGTNEVTFQMNASGASLAIRSGGTLWLFSSSLSTKG